MSSTYLDQAVREVSLPLGISICVPDDLTLMTPYVLLEQGDWFEDEIHFVRRLAAPGMAAVDIGANYGIYTLTLAAIAGPTGRVWAFEPASETAALLARSLERNRFEQVELVRAALSDHEGEARLSTHANAELNTLHGTAADGEQVPLTTLDACLGRFSPRQVAFVKLDAEGEEANIIRGGARFFAQQSPLVMFELKHGAAFETALVENFAAIGYASYRLVPGLGILVPFDPAEPIDPFLLNLFACKPDRARQLAERGLLVMPGEMAAPAETVDDRWYDWLADKTWAAQWLPAWRQRRDADGPTAWLRHREALNAYVTAADERLPPAVRVAALRRSYQLLAALADQESLPRLCSLARVAAESGWRAAAVKALGRLHTLLQQGGALVLDEPFLPLAPQFEALAPGAQLGDWLLGGVLETRVRLSSYSTYFAPQSSRNLLQVATRLAFASPDARRRLELLERRAALASGERGDIDSRCRALFEQGRYAELEELAARLESSGVRDGTLWRGVACVQQERYAEARALLEKATQVTDDSAIAWDFLGTACHELGDYPAARAAYRKALAIRPQRRSSWTNLVNNANKAQWYDEAEAAAREALQHFPDDNPLLRHRAIALHSLGRDAEAVAVLRQVVATDPHHGWDWLVLGDALRALRHLDEAEQALRQACGEDPLLFPARLNLGAVMQEQGRLEEALACFQEAVAIDPGAAPARNNLGLILHQLGRMAAAETALREALRLDPDYPSAWKNLGMVQQDQGEMGAALASYRRALALRPDWIECMSGIVGVHNYLPDVPLPTLVEEARAFGRHVAGSLAPSARYDAWRVVRDAGRALRVGLVSGDLKSHPVGFFLEGVLGALDRRQMTLIAYPTHPALDNTTRRLQRLVDGWVPLYDLDDERAAARIHDDAIDILIDLSGHTANNRLALFARKPAPIQVSWLGYFATTGVEAIDYVLADPWSVPVGEEWQFTEKLWRLPETRFCFTPPREAVAVGDLPRARAGHVTLGCFNNQIKVNDEVVALWAALLKALPDARLFLKNKQLRDADARTRTLERFAAHGIAPQRLRLEGTSPRQEYLARYNEVDFVLDPFPFTGGTTSAEALWMGVPVLTRRGDRMVGHQGEVLLRNVGLAEWIAQDRDDYLGKAVRFARDVNDLARLRGELRARALASPLFDAPRFARNFEAAMRAMWHKWMEKDSGRQMTKRFLHVGCGSNRKERTSPGFHGDEWNEVRLDISEAAQPDILCSMTDMSVIGDGEMDALYSSHNIEHLYPHEVPIALREFWRVLRPEGFCVIGCPDLKSVCRLVAEDRLTEPAYHGLGGAITPLEILYGHLPSLRNGQLYMAHRCGFTRKSLMAALKEAGFARVGILERPLAFDLWAVATKSRCSDDVLNGLMDVFCPDVARG